MRSAESQTAKHRDMTDSRRETFYGELNALLGAGVDFSNAFALLIEAEERGAARAMLERLYARIVEGCSLRRAMSESGAFPPLDCGVVLNALPELTALPPDGGVAERYILPGAQGYVGLIRPVSCQFCAGCNRLRLTELPQGIQIFIHILCAFQPPGCCPCHRQDCQ